MAKCVWLIRHAKQVAGRLAWNPEAQLAPDAHERIDAAARYFYGRGVNFQKIGYSFLTRSKHTAKILFVLMSNPKACMPCFYPKLGPGEMDEWERCWEEWKLSQPDPENLRLTAAEMAELWPDLCKREGKRVLNGIREIARELQDNEHAAAISHNPLLRLAEAQATGNPVAGPDPTYCQAICFTFEDDKFVSSEAHLF